MNLISMNEAVILFITRNCIM